MDKVSAYGVTIGFRGPILLSQFQLKVDVMGYVSQFLNVNDSWNVDLLRTIFLPCDVVEILKICASPRQGDDVLAWGPGKLGTFSVKSAYDMAFEESCRETAQASSYASNGWRACWKLI